MRLFLVGRSICDFRATTVVNCDGKAGTQVDGSLCRPRGFLSMSLAETLAKTKTSQEHHNNGITFVQDRDLKA